MQSEMAMRHRYLGNELIETIYFGGGTPSLLSAEDVNRLVEGIYKHFKVGKIREFTLEANPDDLNIPYLKALRTTPVNRLSIGVQSFRPEDLLYMHRVHTAQQADYGIKAAQDAGYSDLSIDLIYGVPGMKDAAWKDNISRVKEYGIPHLSAYALTVEPRTALHHAIEQKKTAPVDPGQASGQFSILIEETRNMGMEHYEISNFAMPGRHAIHNISYWHGVPYIGIGPGAHSFDGKSRQWNVSNNPRYASALLEEKSLDCEVEQLSQTDTYNESVMTALRTMWGIDTVRVASHWGSEALKHLHLQAAPFIERKWLTIRENLILLTDSGKHFADKISAELFL